MRLTLEEEETRTQPHIKRQTRTYERKWNGKRPPFDPQVIDYMYHEGGSERAYFGDLLQAKMLDHVWNKWYRCEECNNFYPFQAMNIDHKTPWDVITNDYDETTSQGKAKDDFNDVSNLQMLCSSCNLSKSNKVAEVLEEG